MKLTQITVSYGATQSLPEYSNVKPNLTLTATLDPGDDPTQVEAQLWAMAKEAVHAQIDDALERNGIPARYSDEPRFQVMKTRTQSYYDRGQAELPKIVVILPNDLKRPDDRLVHAAYPESRKLRYQHALRIAADTAESAEAVLLDCADGDLTRLLAALPVAPTAPEASIEYAPPVDDWTSPLDEEIEDDNDNDDEEEEEEEEG